VSSDFVAELGPPRVPSFLVAELGCKVAKVLDGSCRDHPPKSDPDCAVIKVTERQQLHLALVDVMMQVVMVVMMFSYSMPSGS
jgi:hypothetical protein